MGAVFAAAARPPISAVIIIFELTGEYQIILPLMFAVALAAGIGNLLSRDTIYTLKLWRRGIDLACRRDHKPPLAQRFPEAPSASVDHTRCPASRPMKSDGAKTPPDPPMPIVRLVAMILPISNTRRKPKTYSPRIARSSTG